MRHRFMLTVISSLLALALAEIALQMLEYPEPINFGWGGFGDSPTPRDNSDFVLVLLGDSQVANANGETPGVLLEKKLAHAGAERCLGSFGRDRFEVITIFAPGWGQDQQLIALRRYFDSHRADLVVLWETPENDLWNNAFPTHFPLNGEPKPTFVINRQGQLIQTAKSEIIPFWMETKLCLLGYLALKNLDESRAVNLLTNWILGRRITFRHLLWDPDHDWDKYLPPPLDVEQRSDDTDSRRYLARFNPYVERDPIDLEKTHFVLGLNDGSLRIESMARLTNLLIREIQKLSIENGAGFFAISYSAKDTEQPLYPPTGRYRIGSTSFLISEKAATRRLALVNQGVKYHEITLSEKKWRREGYNPHLSAAGNREMMGHLSEILVRTVCGPSGLAHPEY